MSSAQQAAATCNAPSKGKLPRFKMDDIDSSSDEEESKPLSEPMPEEPDPRPATPPGVVPQVRGVHRLHCTIDPGLELRVVRSWKIS